MQPTIQRTLLYKDVISFSPNFCYGWIISIFTYKRIERLKIGRWFYSTSKRIVLIKRHFCGYATDVTDDFAEPESLGTITELQP